MRSLAATVRTITIVLALTAGGASIPSANAYAHRLGSVALSRDLLRVNAGGGATAALSGPVWSADCCSVGGMTYSNSVPIAGTTSPILYQSQRWNRGPFAYRFTGLSPGRYRVTLRFAEIAYLGPGRRRFNVAVQGRRVLTDFDVAAQVGLDTALDKTFVATVGSKGRLTIAFSRGDADNPIVNAIQIKRATSAPAPAQSRARDTGSPREPAATADDDPSGVPMPVGDIPGWHEVFTDDFTADVPLGSFPEAVSSKWTAYPYPWSGTPASGTYDPERTVSVHGGMMDIWLHTETMNGTAAHLIAAVVPKINGPGVDSDQLYGRYVIRYKTDRFGYYHASWLLWPKSETWPADGEIDFPEADFDSKSTSAFMHWQNGTSGGSQDAYATSSPMYGAWHTAVIEWLPDRCRFLLDGKVIGTSTSRVPDTPMHWVIQNGVSSSEPAPPDSAQGHVYVDWVAVYRPS
jgi:hypothetical protein